MIDLEEMIIKGLGNLGKVDGHDAGAGQTNIFILTEHPKMAFQAINLMLGTKDFAQSMKVAYREIGTDTFNIIHPPGLTGFSLT